MGTCIFRTMGYGTSARDAFNVLCKESIAEYGHQQGYSGCIHDTLLVADKTSGYKSAKDKEKYLTELEMKVDKRDTYYIELKAPKSNTNKIKSVVELKPQKGARKWETVYEVYGGYESDIPIAKEKTQGAAVKKARAHTEKTQTTTYIEIVKRITNGSPSVGTIRYKTSKSESKGKYLFIVAAPE